MKKWDLKFLFCFAGASICGGTEMCPTAEDICTNPEIANSMRRECGMYI